MTGRKWGIVIYSTACTALLAAMYSLTLNYF